MTANPQRFEITVLELGPMENFVYLIRDFASGRVAVVDPAWEPREILKAVSDKNLRITDILLTHSHNDHINAIDDVLAVYDAQVHLSSAEAKFWGRYQDLPTLHRGGDVIRLGDTPIDVLHTPGHTPGSACYKVGDQLVAGDTLFVFGCGRCDLRGGDPSQLFDTLKKLRSDLPPQTILLPGHHYADRKSSTLQEQYDGNPFFHFDRREDFVHYRMVEHDRTRRPPLTPVRRAES